MVGREVKRGMEKVVFNYSKLKGRIVEKLGSQKAFADLLGISEGTLTSKLRGYTYFTQSEIRQSIGILGIDPQDVSLYFFAV